MRGAPTAILIATFMAGGLAGGGMMMRPGHAEIASGGFDALMAQSMARMHADMSVPPSGDPDRDFAAMMIPHHQGAIDMAKAELAYGRDPVLRRLAQGIIVEQAQEIEIMRHALAERPLANAATPKSPAEHHH
ncbi:CopM family metallochaperone [Methylorubrum extorquens]|uniref:DUF305 domain-containing protein n=1 Tax=Methylorubrum extorquens (strain CM4 / NCIMB 13688) TaxID=440085 RepID=B7L3P1_METC4|nr:DUF305 domain-containing protein [Methylorubrum extorquens]ACK86449.1 protein of unknown function DUF305 [Methylorubrum extorquens CM4]